MEATTIRKQIRRDRRHQRQASTYHRIPVTVKNYDRVRSRQVQSQSTSACRQQKDEVGRVGSIELVHSLFAFVGRCGSIKTKRQIATEGEVIFKDCHHLCHLRKNQNTMTCGFQLGEHLVQEGHLARRSDDRVVDLIPFWREEHGVIRYLAQLHYYIVQPARGSCLFNKGIIEQVVGFHRFHTDLLVKFFLPRRKIATQHLLNFLRQLIEYLCSKED
jgi:hypothetical protein